MTPTDPVERIQANIELMVEEQRGVPVGSFRCPSCDTVIGYEPISVSARPDAPVLCYPCLPDDVRKAYDLFERGYVPGPNDRMTEYEGCDGEV